MFEASSGQPISFSITSDPSKIINVSKSKLSGSDAMLVINESGAGKFSGFGSDNDVSFEITATQAGNGSYHAAQSVSRTVKIKKPSKSVFFEERKADVRYEGVKDDALARISSKLGITGEKALALFNSDNYDSDGDGVSNLLERAFGGDSLSNDRGDTLPEPMKKNDNYERIVFTRYNSTYQVEMGLEYIVEESSDLRTWSEITASPESAVDLGGGMERVVFKTTSQTTSGSTQYIRVRVKAR